MDVRLPEIRGGAVIFLLIIGGIVGALTGTHQEWWVQVLAIGTIFTVIHWFGPGEMSDLAYFPGAIAFVLGCIVGDVNWWFQVGNELSTISISNPFLVK